MEQLLSVLVPAYQVENYLDAALASILGQPIARLEVVIVDDGSRDATAAVARAWSERDGRVRAVLQARNEGMTPTWNRLLREARGELVFKLDGDDCLEPGALGRLLEAWDRTPGIRLAAFRAVECDEGLRPVGPYRGEEIWRRAGWDPAEDRVERGWFWYERCFDDLQPWHSSALLLSRRALEELGGWEETWACASDTDLILKLLATELPVLHLGVVGVRYRRHPASVSATAEREGWKSLEAVLVPLASLRRERRRALRIRRLRRAWHRLDAARREIVERLGSDSRPLSPHHRRLLELAREVPPAPAWVRLEGGLHDRLWRIFRSQRA